MSLIQISGLTFGYEGSPENVFENVSLRLDTDWRLGLTGRNAAENNPVKASGGIRICRDDYGGSRFCLLSLRGSGRRIFHGGGSGKRLRGGGGMAGFAGAETARSGRIAFVPSVFLAVGRGTDQGAACGDVPEGKRVSSDRRADESP